MGHREQTRSAHIDSFRMDIKELVEKNRELQATLTTANEKIEKLESVLRSIAMDAYAQSGLMSESLIGYETLVHINEKANNALLTEDKS